ncbi:MAG: ferrous iron transport protein B [Candidatus Omnitrophota bacterium]
MMSGQVSSTLPTADAAIKRIALVGNPNTGKTTLFNAITGLNQKVANYPGVTVERKSGRLKLGAYRLETIDLPGTYSLAARSLDESVVTDVLFGCLDGEPPIDLIVAIADAGNLTRNLYLVSQALELGTPVVVALNMMDIAEAKGVKIDCEGLSQRLGVPFVPVCANRRKGIGELLSRMEETLEQGGSKPRETPILPETLRLGIYRLKEWIAARSPEGVCPFRDAELLRALVDAGKGAEKRLAILYGEEIGVCLESLRLQVGKGASLAAIEAEARYKWINNLLASYIQKPDRLVRTRSDRIDEILTHKLFGGAVFVFLMAFVFQAIYVGAGPLMDAIDSGFGFLGEIVSAFLPEGALRSLIADGIIAGAGGVLVFLPQIAILFFLIAILEDCGYLPRAAYLMDKLLSHCGLSGKSFIPMLSSFACAIPGIMATRTIENRRDRLVTILVAPLMSCSARLPVYLIFIAAFIPDERLFGSWIGLRGFVLLLFYLLGVGLAIPIAWFLKKVLVKGYDAPFVMEMPSYKIPGLRTVFLFVFEQSKAFVLRAGTVILSVTVVVWALAYFPHSSSILQRYDRLRDEAAEQFRKNSLPLLTMLDSNAYSSSMSGGDIGKAMENDPRFQNPSPQLSSNETLERILALRNSYQEELDRIGGEEQGELVRSSFLGRLGKWIEPAVQPLGWDWRIGMAAISSLPARELVVASLGTIFNVGADSDESSVSLRQAIMEAKRDDGAPLFNLAVALSIMVFFALCCQCAATLAVIRRETNSWKWPLFAFGYMTALGYIGAFAAYHLTMKFYLS